MKSAKFFIIIASIIYFYSCNNSENSNKSEKDSTTNLQKTETNNTLPDFSGHYSLPKGSCDLDLTITKENNIFNYNLRGEDDKLDVYGTLIINREADNIYLTFDGPIGNNKPKSVEAVYLDGNITIQNSGNVDQGSWVLFPFCCTKYLEFKKN